MNTIILNLQTTSKTAIASDKQQTRKPYFKQRVKIRTFFGYECCNGHFRKILILKSKKVQTISQIEINFKIWEKIIQSIIYVSSSRNNQECKEIENLFMKCLG